MATELNESAKKITELCRESREKFPASDMDGDGEDETKCNFAVRHVAIGFAEYTGFGRMLANQMVRHMGCTAEWAIVPPEAAKTLADAGNLVIAGRTSKGHGHVAVVLPGAAMVPSSKWGGEWPTVSQVGTSNWICGASYAFPWIPTFYVLID